jgi:hypothetical protein
MFYLLSDFDACKELWYKDTELAEGRFADLSADLPGVTGLGSRVYIVAVRFHSH